MEELLNPKEQTWFKEMLERVLESGVKNIQNEINNNEVTIHNLELHNFASKMFLMCLAKEKELKEAQETIEKLKVEIGACSFV